MLITEGETVTSTFLHGAEEDPYGLGETNLMFTAKRWHAWALSDREAIAHAGGIERTVAVGDEPVGVAGIGSVIAHPDHRRAGGAGAAVAAMLGFMQGEHGLEFGMLVCLPELVGYYRRSGWRALEVPVTCEQPDGTIRWPLELMVIELGDEVWPDGPVDLRGLPW